MADLYDKNADDERDPYNRIGNAHDFPLGDTSPEQRTATPGAAELEDSESNGGSLFNPGGDGEVDSPDNNDLENAESNAGGATNGRSGFFTPDKKSNRNIGDTLRKHRKKIAIAVAAVGTTGSLISLVFMGLSSFGLNNAMANIERASFMRYQVDLNGRSSKWIQTYMMLRMAEVDDPKLAPKDRDNILFRSNRVDNNKPLTDWYRTMRSSKFEQDVFEKRGIKFTSVAYREGNVTKFRPGLVTINGNQEVKFNLSNGEMDAIQNGDINGFNNRLHQFVDVQVFENDKQARVALRSMLSEEFPGWWNGVKRYHLRHDIQNMVGVRKWSFFENTRNKISDKKISIRNKIIAQSLPEDSKSGKFIQCLFGISDCKASSDPANPESNALNASGSNKEGDKAGDADNNPNTPDTPLGDGSGESTIQAGADGALTDGIRKTILSKISGAGSVLSLIDSLARFDKALHDHSLSKLIVQAKTAQAAGLFTTFAVASDQMHTGEMSSDEVSDFMQQFQNPTASEGWTTVIDPQHSGSTASADSTSFTMAKNKGAFCSEQHQAEIDKPENRAAADQEFQFLCPQDQIGGAAKTQALENAWDGGPGAVLHPILAVYHSTIGSLIGVFNSITGAVTGPIINGALKGLGLEDNVQNATAYVAEKAVDTAGGNLDINDNTPSGKVFNTALQGGTATAEASMRDQGAAATTVQTAALANKNTVAWLNDQQHSSLYNRYLAISNPQSLLSHQLMAVSVFSHQNISQSLSKSFGSIFSNFSSAFSLTVHADDTTTSGYAAAQFADIDTYDMPKECLNSDPLDATPQSVTNADDLGYIPAADLNWDMLNNKEKFYAALYAGVNGDEDKAKKVWNCALLDNSVRGGIGATYGYKGEDAYTGSSSSSQASSGSSSNDNSSAAPSGDVKQLAQQALDQASKGKIVFDHEWDAQGDAKDGSAPEQNMKETADGKPAQTTSNCSGRGAQPPNSTVVLNGDLLKFIIELSQVQSFRINALAGECHGEQSSNHYKGVAVDIGCPFDPTNANKIGAKYNISDQTGENCANAGHYHYSVGGH